MPKLKLEIIGDYYEDKDVLQSYIMASNYQSALYEIYRKCWNRKKKSELTREEEEFVDSIICECGLKGIIE